MSQTRHASNGKRSKKALPVLSVAGLSLAATTAGGIAEIRSPATVPLRGIPLHEEEISDVSLATFHLSGQENTGVNRSIMHLARGGCGCRGCGG